MRAKPFPSGLVGLPLIKVSIFAPPAFFPLKKKKKIQPSKVKDLEEGRLSSFGILCFPSDKDAFSQRVQATHSPFLPLGFPVLQRSVVGV